MRSKQEFISWLDEIQLTKEGIPLSDYYKSNVDTRYVEGFLRGDQYPISLRQTGSSSFILLYSLYRLVELGESTVITNFRLESARSTEEIFNEGLLFDPNEAFDGIEVIRMNDLLLIRNKSKREVSEVSMVINDDFNFTNNSEAYKREDGLKAIRSFAIAGYGVRIKDGDDYPIIKNLLSFDP